MRGGDLILMHEKLTVCGHSSVGGLLDGGAVLGAGICGGFGEGGDWKVYVEDSVMGEMNPVRVSVVISA